MIPFSEFTESKHKLETCKDRKGLFFYNNIFTFDIETSSAFLINGQLQPFDYSKPKEYYKDFEKISFMYIWQFGIDDVVYFGRTWEELKKFWCVVSDTFHCRKIVYVHNLAYEFQFLLNIIEDSETIKQFARKPHKVMKFELADYNMLFRCSYMLSGMSLEKVAKNYKLPVKKLVGELDYIKIRYATTKLSKKEIEYCENDILIMYYYLLTHKERYKNIQDIPLTQTGEVRRIVQKLVKNDAKYFKKICQQQPKDFKELQLLTSVFMGGYTHANADRCNEIIENVKSKDITSSYPTVMVCEKFPCSSFFPIRCNDITELESTFEDNAYIFDIIFYNIRSTKYNNYISVSKTVNRAKVVEDNGRVVRADKIQIKVNEVDYSIIKRCYKWEKMEIIKTYKATKGYLDKRIVQFILELFANKTTLKGIKEKEDLYMKSKQFINSLYGMCVTNNVTDEIILNDNFEWEKILLTEESANEKLDKMRKSRKTFLNFSWGVWVTSYARRNLWNGIVEIDFDVVYCDTDSIKYVGDYEEFFNDYNKEIINKLCVSVTTQGIDKELLFPKDNNGKVQTLGVWDTEKPYKRFKTMGAKKYCCEYEEGTLAITVSGVNKKAVCQLKIIEEFKEGLQFTYKNSGRLIMSYLSNMPQLKVLDDNCNEIELNCKFGIHAMPTTYELGIADTYEDYLLSLSNSETEYAEIRKGV